MQGARPAVGITAQSSREERERNGEDGWERIGALLGKKARNNYHSCSKRQGSKHSSRTVAGTPRRATRKRANEWRLAAAQAALKEQCKAGHSQQ